jgi:hypothetical protein
MTTTIRSTRIGRLAASARPARAPFGHAGTQGNFDVHQRRGVARKGGRDIMRSQMAFATLRVSHTSAIACCAPAHPLLPLPPPFSRSRLAFMRLTTGLRRGNDEFKIERFPVILAIARLQSSSWLDRWIAKPEGASLSFHG